MGTTHDDVAEDETGDEDSLLAGALEPAAPVCRSRAEPQVSAPALNDATEIWLYLSGGGLRSVFGSFGLMFFLHEAGDDVVGKVRRIASV